MRLTKLLILSTCLTGLAIVVQAQSCAVRPDCESLGYKKTEDDCAGLKLLRCPFDTTKVFCGGDICSYTNTVLPANCATADNCMKGSTTYYSNTCTQCNSGYDLSGGVCVSSCSYTKTSKPSNCKTADSCSKNNKTYYSDTCTQCNSGYTLSSGNCVCTGDNSCQGSYAGSCSGTIDSSTKDGCGNTCYYCEITETQTVTRTTAENCKVNSVSAIDGYIYVDCTYTFSNICNGYHRYEHSRTSGKGNCDEDGGQALCDSKYVGKSVTEVCSRELIK